VETKIRLLFLPNLSHINITLNPPLQKTSGSKLKITAS